MPVGSFVLRRTLSHGETPGLDGRAEEVDTAAASVGQNV